MSAQTYPFSIARLSTSTGMLYNLGSSPSDLGSGSGYQVSGFPNTISGEGGIRRTNISATNAPTMRPTATNTMISAGPPAPSNSPPLSGAAVGQFGCAETTVGEGAAVSEEGRIKYIESAGMGVGIGMSRVASLHEGV